MKNQSSTGYRLRGSEFSVRVENLGPPNAEGQRQGNLTVKPAGVASPLRRFQLPSAMVRMLYALRSCLSSTSSPTNQTGLHPGKYRRASAVTTSTRSDRLSLTISDPIPSTCQNRLRLDSKPRRIMVVSSCIVPSISVMPVLCLFLRWRLEPPRRPYLSLVESPCGTNRCSAWRQIRAVPPKPIQDRRVHPSTSKRQRRNPLLVSLFPVPWGCRGLSGPARSLSGPMKQRRHKCGV